MNTVFSPCRIYRYTLWREWPSMVPIQPGFVAFIGLNPSTADEERNDPTIRRCLGYARQWGYAAFCMLNLFAYRATDPRVMQRADDPIGPENDEHLLRVSRRADLIVAAWGCGGDFLNRADQVRALIPNLRCLRLTKHGHPQHPLYLPKDAKPIPYPRTRP